MKKPTFLLILNILSSVLIAQREHLKVVFDNETLDNHDTIYHFDKWKGTIDKIVFEITADIPLYTEDIEFYLDGEVRGCDKHRQLLRVNPSRVTKDFKYLITIRNFEYSTVSLRVQNYKYNFYSFVVLHDTEPKDLITDIVWKHPIQANRDDKTGISTALKTYFVNLEINTSEPIGLDDLRFSINGKYYNIENTKKKLSKTIFYSGAYALWKYDYTQELPLEEGVNTIQLEVHLSKVIPQRPKYYSTILYIKKE